MEMDNFCNVQVSVDEVADIDNDNRSRIRPVESSPEHVNAIEIVKKNIGTPPRISIPGISSNSIPASSK